jgi:hypothetical protein
MNKYVVKVVHVFSNVIETDAASEEEARHNVLELLEKENNNQSFNNYYESTLPPEDWAVILKSDFDNIKAQVEKELKTNGVLEKANEETPNISEQ